MIFNEWLVDVYNSIQGTPVIFPKKNFDAKWAAERFRKAMRGMGSDEKMIIKMLIQHSNEQRGMITHAYKLKYGRVS